MKRYPIKDLLEQICKNKCETLFEKKYKKTRKSILEEKSSIKPFRRYALKKIIRETNFWEKDGKNIKKKICAITFEKKSKKIENSIKWLQQKIWSD